jgi:hypothetical protein
LHYLYEPETIHQCEAFHVCENDNIKGERRRNMEAGFDSVRFSKEQAAGNTQWLDANIPIQRRAIDEVTYQVLSSWKIAALSKTNCQLQVIELNKLQRKMKA